MMTDQNGGFLSEEVFLLPAGKLIWSREHLGRYVIGEAARAAPAVQASPGAGANISSYFRIFLHAYFHTFLLTYLPIISGDRKGSRKLYLFSIAYKDHLRFLFAERVV